MLTISSLRGKVWFFAGMLAITLLVVLVSGQLLDAQNRGHGFRLFEAERAASGSISNDLLNTDPMEYVEEIQRMMKDPTLVWFKNYSFDPLSEPNVRDFTSIHPVFNPLKMRTPIASPLRGTAGVVP